MSELSDAVARVKAVHGDFLGLASAASKGDVEEVEEHAEELREAIADVEELVGAEQ